jgi:chloramphenicol-sensitive protein RarD
MRRRAGAYGARHEHQHAPRLSRPTKPPRGFLFALSAYLLWGFLPFFMKAVAHIPAPRWWRTASPGRCRSPALLLVARPHRRYQGRLALAAHFRHGTLTATLITINWGIYVWAIGVDRALEAHSAITSTRFFRCFSALSCSARS